MSPHGPASAGAPGAPPPPGGAIVSAGGLRAGAAIGPQKGAGPRGSPPNKAAGGGAHGAVLGSHWMIAGRGGARAAREGSKRSPGGGSAGGLWRRYR